MITACQQEKYLEATRAACRWYYKNQNTDDRPWGGIKNSADHGRFIYEYFPEDRMGRGGVVWSQALGIMALDAVNARSLRDPEKGIRRQSAILAGEYLQKLQYTNPAEKENFGGFAETVPGDRFSYPRDAATGGMGLCALYRMTGDRKYLDAAVRFADWYRNHGSDSDGWPYITYDFLEKEGTNLLPPEPGTKETEMKEAIKGDWQAGGALFYYYLASVTGNRKYIEDYMLPMMPRLINFYEKNPPNRILEGFHCEVEVSYGNDDFALVTLLSAYMATGNKRYFEAARDRIKGLLLIMDQQTGKFPSFGGTFVCGITMHVLNELEKHLGRKPDPKLVSAVEKVAENGLQVQAFDYNDMRIHGGFWGQTNYDAARYCIHHRTTGYATIFYSMLGSKTVIPYYNCLGWDIPKKSKKK